jgi:SnoaL-like domain
MSVAISRSPAEDPETVKRLLNANLFKVFGERDTTARYSTIGETYHKDVLWHEPDRLVHGWEAMSKRAGEILAEAPGFQFITDGEPIVTQNLGILSWKFGPDADPELVKGTDVILVEDGKIKVLWTAVTKVP